MLNVKQKKKELNERRIQSRKNADERHDTVKEESMIKNEREEGRIKRMVCLNFFIFSCSYGYIHEKRMKERNEK